MNSKLGSAQLPLLPVVLVLGLENCGSQARLKFHEESPAIEEFLAYISRYLNSLRTPYQRLIKLVRKMSNKLRKQNFIDNHVQGSLVRRILMHWAIFFVVTCMLVGVLNALSGDPSLPFMEKLWGSSGELGLVAISMIVLFPVFALDTVRFSNRFVGPISRLRRSLRELGETNTTEKIQFRDNDFWAEMAEEFNTVVDMVEDKRQTATPQEETVSA